ncbi:helix-turn-helix domain-containing protein [Ramlibacter tataouinensis]|uniref:helix-turn-helix domain-containing protein n=1 Tax=Ramlibacter tataouinensis TaxID=94132 RepID=UPI0022F3E595|nr:helix-turn-helix domain-containing protein [Ramlibacter tataouinensis]WBY02800.1 helix-turn-helix domain-containing protein [Ramlibacter tataouinensis]
MTDLATPEPAADCVPCALQDYGGCEAAARTRLKVKRGGILFRQNEAFRSFLAVRRGSFKSVAVAPDGREQVLAFVLAGDLLGLDGFGHARHASTAIALEDSEVLVLDYGMAGAQAAPALHHAMARVLSRELLRDVKLKVLLASMSAEQKLASFLLNLSRRLHDRGGCPDELALRMTRTDIASYLGLSLETVCRTLTSLQRRGVVQVDGRHLRLLDRRALLRQFGRDG